MFQANDTVIYGAHGVCNITEVTKKDFCGERREYYALTPVYNGGTTIYVPADNPTLTGKMRRVLSAEEIYRIIHSMPREETLWVENEPERRVRYQTILTGGDRRELVGMIKALYLHKQDQLAKRKHLHASDEIFLRDAEKLLYDEFALVLDIEPEQVLPFITRQIEIGVRS